MVIVFSQQFGNRVAAEALATAYICMYILALVTMPFFLVLAIMWISPLL